MALNDFAKNTKVSMDSSRAELERLLRRAGATKTMTGWDGNTAFVAFVLEGVPIRQKVTMPSRESFSKTGQGRDRRQEAALRAWEQGCRQRMREFVQLLKAKLIGVSIGLRTIEHEFFSDICLPTGQTVFEQQAEELHTAMAAGRMPKMLLGI